MRINRYIASATDISRRRADRFISEQRVKIDNQIAVTGQEVIGKQTVTLDGQIISLPTANITIMLNKPVNYVVSRKGQGSSTVYSLLPKKYKNLKPVGRLDKDSSGLLILSNDGQLIQSLAHPSFNKQKVYKVVVDKAVKKRQLILLSKGVMLEDGPSKLKVKESYGNKLTVAISEGRNRQIRRTFKALGYNVTNLERISFGKYTLGNLQTGAYVELRS